MSNNKRRRAKRHLSRKAKNSITIAIFILAILVVILCIMSGALDFKKVDISSSKESETPEVTAPPQEETPEPSEEPDEPDTYTISVFAGHGGSATPSGTVTIDAGANLTITFIPDEGYHVATLTINGELVDPVNSYTFRRISSNMTVDVSFDVDEEEPEEEPEESESPLEEISSIISEMIQ